MELSKLIAVALLGTTLSILLRRDKPEMSLFIGLITGISIFLFAIYKLSFIMDTLKNLGSKVNINYMYISTIVKIVGISYLMEFAINICKDAGETAIGTKLEFGGKVIILTLTFPILLSIVDTIIKIIP